MYLGEHIRFALCEPSLNGMSGITRLPLLTDRSRRRDIIDTALVAAVDEALAPALQPEPAPARRQPAAYHHTSRQALLAAAEGRPTPTPKESSDVDVFGRAVPHREDRIQAHTIATSLPYDDASPRTTLSPAPASPYPPVDSVTSSNSPDAVTHAENMRRVSRTIARGGQEAARAASTLLQHGSRAFLEHDVDPVQAAAMLTLPDLRVSSEAPQMRSQRVRPIEIFRSAQRAMSRARRPARA